MGAILQTSFLSVLLILAICAVGAWLGRRGTMHLACRRDLSRIIILVLLPSLLFSKLSVSASLDNLLGWSPLPIVACLYVAMGFLIGHLTCRCLNIAPDLRRPVIAAIGLGNSGYIPIPLVGAVAATAPLFAQDPGAADRGIAYISFYVMALSPCIWGIGYPYLADNQEAKVPWRQLLPPPIYAVIAGATIGIVPALRQLIIPADAPLRLLHDCASLLGQAAVPCALLVLGANLGEKPASPPTSLPLKPVAAVILSRMLLMPLIGIGLVSLLERWALIPADPMFSLVLLIESCVPPATALIIICQAHHHHEQAMARLLYWSYLAAVPGLTFLISLFLWMLQPGK